MRKWTGYRFAVLPSIWFIVYHTNPFSATAHIRIRKSILVQYNSRFMYRYRCFDTFLWGRLRFFRAFLSFFFLIFYVLYEKKYILQIYNDTFCHSWDFCNFLKKRHRRIVLPTEVNAKTPSTDWILDPVKPHFYVLMIIDSLQYIS